MRINNNLMAMNTHRQMGIANNAGAKSMEKLSSGYRINRAGDDAAGLAISEKMRGQIRGLTQASRNAQDGISLIQTAEGALDETHAILQRMRELAVQSATDTNTSADRLNIQDEIDQLAAEITRISETTEFNTMKLLDDSFDGKKFHIGANQDQNVELSIGDMGSVTLGVGRTGFEASETEAGLTFNAFLDDLEDDITIKFAELDAGNGEAVKFKVEESAGTITVTLGQKIASDGAEAGEVSTTLEDIKAALADKGIRVEGKLTGEVSGLADKEIKIEVEAGTEATIKGVELYSQEKADAAITTINDALSDVSKQRSALGAVQNRLEHTIKNLDTSAENLQASEARIRDVDMAHEMMEQTKQNILQQASTAMLAQANAAPQTVLQLLQ